MVYTICFCIYSSASALLGIVIIMLSLCKVTCNAHFQEEVHHSVDRRLGLVLVPTVLHTRHSRGLLGLLQHQ